MSNMLTLKCKQLHSEAKVPKFALAHDAGLDLCAREVIKFAPGERKGIATGLAFAIPEGYVGLIWDKSGIALKRGLKTMGGVIDAGYRGEVIVIAKNLSPETLVFSAGEKVAQLLIQKVEHPLVEEVSELPESERGESAFGSTGL